METYDQARLRRTRVAAGDGGVDDARIEVVQEALNGRRLLSAEGDRGRVRGREVVHKLVRLRVRDAQLGPATRSLGLRVKGLGTSSRRQRGEHRAVQEEAQPAPYRHS